jgi:hypothetical protein
MNTERTSSGRDAVVAVATRWDATPPPDIAVALHNLVQAYALFTDDGRADELASLFTADATWDGSELGYGSARGPQAIADTVLQHFDPDRPMVHIPGPPLLATVSATEVRGVGWCMATRSSGDRPAPLIFFHYDDDFRRDDDGVWRFSRRTLLLRFRSG